MATVEDKMVVFSGFKGRWNLKPWNLQQSDKEVTKFERVPTKETYLIPIIRTESSIIYDRKIHDPKYTTNDSSSSSSPKPLNDSAFQAGAHFFASITAEFGNKLKRKSIESEFESSMDEVERREQQKNSKKSKLSDQEDDSDIWVIDENEVIEIPANEERENVEGDTEVEILDDDHIPVANGKEPTVDKEIRRCLTILADNSIKLIFDKTNQDSSLSSKTSPATNMNVNGRLDSIQSQDANDKDKGNEKRHGKCVEASVLETVIPEANILETETIPTYNSNTTTRPTTWETVSRLFSRRSSHPRSANTEMETVQSGENTRNLETQPEMNSISATPDFLTVLGPNPDQAARNVPETMVFHRGAQSPVPVTENASAEIPTRKRKRHRKDKANTRIPTCNDTLENNYSTLKTLVEAEVKSLMKTTLMKEIQKNIVNSFLREKDLTLNFASGANSSLENGIQPGIFSPSLLPVEEVSSDIIPTNQAEHSHCNQINCTCQRSSTTSPASDIASQNRVPSRRNSTTAHSPIAEGLFYSDLRLLASHISPEGLENFEQGWSPQSVPAKKSKRKSTGSSGKRGRPKKTKEIENNMIVLQSNYTQNNNFVETPGMGSSSAQLIGLENTQPNGQETPQRMINPTQVKPTDLRKNSKNPLPPGQNSNLVAFEPSLRNENLNQIQNQPIIDMNNHLMIPPPSVTLRQLLGKDNNPLQLPMPIHPGQVQQPPGGSFVRPIFNPQHIRQQMHYEQISPPTQFSHNPDLNFINNGNSVNVNYDGRRCFFLSPNEHQQFLVNQQQFRGLVSNGIQNSNPNSGRVFPIQPRFNLHGQPNYPA